MYYVYQGLTLVYKGGTKMKIDKGLYTYTRNEKNLIAKTNIKKIKNSEQVKCRAYVLVNFNLMKTVICYADLKDKYIGKDIKYIHTLNGIPQTICI